MQHFEVIKPTISPDNHTQTFVYSFTSPSEDLPTEENIYTILTIWSQPDDLRQIATQIKEVFSTIYYEDVTGGSSELRFKKSLQGINKGLTEINLYYHKLEKRFHIEGLIVVVSDNTLLISSIGDVQAYKIGSDSIMAVVDSHKKSQHQNIFSIVETVKFLPGEKLILTSARFSDHIPKTLLYSFLQPDNPITFQELKRQTHSLQNSHLGAIFIENKSIISSQDKIATSSSQAVDTPEPLKTVDKPSIFKKSLKKVQRIVKKSTKVINTYFIRPLKKQFKRLWNTLWSKYINPNPLIPLVVLGLSIVIIVVLFGYFSWYNPHNQNLKNTYSSIEQSLQTAQSQIKNNQKSAALTTLDQTRQKINAVSPKDQQTLNKIQSQDKKPTLNDLQNTISQLEDQLKGITRVSAATLYQNPKAGASYSSLALLGENVYAVNSSTGEITASAKNASTSKTIGSNPELKGTLSLTPSAVSNSLFALTSDSVYQIKPDGTITKQSTTSSSWPSSVAIAAYLQNIYLLSPSDNQIYRFTKSSSGFGAKTAYLKKTPSGLLVDATSLSVTGNVFVAKRNGDILLFDQGNQKDFQISGKPTDMIDISEIVYTELPDQLIVLNPIKKAFILLALKDTGAEYIKEVIVNSTSDISSFGYDAKDKNVYFTTNNQIQKFTLQ